MLGAQMLSQSQDPKLRMWSAFLADVCNTSFWCCPISSFRWKWGGWNAFVGIPASSQFYRGNWRSESLQLPTLAVDQESQRYPLTLSTCFCKEHTFLVCLFVWENVLEKPVSSKGLPGKWRWWQYLHQKNWHTLPELPPLLPHIPKQFKTFPTAFTWNPAFSHYP